MMLSLHAVAQQGAGHGTTTRPVPATGAREVAAARAGHGTRPKSSGPPPPLPQPAPVPARPAPPAQVEIEEVASDVSADSELTVKKRKIDTEPPYPIE